MNLIIVTSLVILWLVVLFNLFLTLALVRRLNKGAASEQPEQLKPGERAPDFTAQTLPGETVTRTDYAGRSAAFVFVSPTCPPCREALPHLEETRPKANRAGVELVLVSTVDAQQTQSWVDDSKISLPVIVAPQESNTFLKDYKVAGTPAYCLVDSRGHVQSTGFISPNHEGWKALLDTWNPAAPAALGLSLAEGGD